MVAPTTSLLCRGWRNHDERNLGRAAADPADGTWDGPALARGGPVPGGDDYLPVAAGTGSWRGALSMAGTACLRPGSQDSQWGRYQLRSPRSDIDAGMSTPRTTVASMSTAAARATPNILNSITDSVAKMENTATMITAALVTTPALPAIPPLIDSRVVHPRIRSSLIRDRMNT